MELMKILGLTPLHSERPKLYAILAFLSAIGLRCLVKCIPGACNQLRLLLQTPGPGCSKLTTSLVNETLKFQTSISQIGQYFLLKKCEKLIFSTKNFSVFGYKAVKRLTS